MRLILFSVLFFILTCCGGKSESVVEKKFSKEENTIEFKPEKCENLLGIDYNDLTGVNGVSLEESTDRSEIFFESKSYSGKMKKCRKNGIVEFTGEYLNGKLERKWIYYHENGRKWMEGLYNNSMRVGEWNYYNESGDLYEILTYKNGDYISTRKV